MELWTIRNLSELDNIEKHGRLITDNRKIDPDFIPAYKWIAAELGARVDKPCIKCRYPIWAWECWDLDRNKKPDLRVRWGIKDENLILIKVNIPDNFVLLSEYHLWHYVLNKWYLPRDIKDQMNFEKILFKGNLNNEWPFQEPFHTLVTDSWQRIFFWKKLNSDFHGENLGSSIQAVFWELKEEWIMDVKHFKSK